MARDRFRDSRQHPFSLVTHDAMEAIQREFGDEAGTGKDKALALYMALAYKASKDRAKGGAGVELELTRREIGAIAGISTATVTRHYPRLVAAGVLEVEQQKLEGTSANAPSLWVLVEPTQGSAHGEPRVRSARSEGSAQDEPRVGSQSAEGSAQDEPVSTEKEQRKEERRESAEWRFSAFLTQQSGESAEGRRYGDRQLADARWLLANKDTQLLRSVIEWAVTRTYWAPKTVNATTLRRWWDQMHADYRADRARNGTGSAREDARRERTRERIERSRG